MARAARRRQDRRQERYTGLSGETVAAVQPKDAMDTQSARFFIETLFVKPAADSTFQRTAKMLAIGDIK